MAMFELFSFPFSKLQELWLHWKTLWSVVQGEVTLNGSSVTGIVFVQEGDEIRSGANAF